MSFNLASFLPEKSIELKSRFIIYFSMVGIIALLVFGTFSIFNHNIYYGIFELFLASVAILNLVFFSKYKHIQIAASIVLLNMAVLLFFLFFTGGINQTGLFWMPLFPILSLFLLNKKWGSYINSFFFLVLIIIVVLSLVGAYTLPFTFIELRQFFASYIAISLIIFFYELVNDSAWDNLESKTKQLADVNQKLDAEAALKEKTQNATQKSVAELEDTKNAMLNIMEDLQDQQNKLVQSKAKDEAMLLSIGDGLIATDEQGIILFTNPSFEEMTGWKQSEVVGKKLIDVLPLVTEEGKKVPPEERLVSKTLRDKIISKTKRKNIFYETKQKKKLPVSITVSPILVEGKVIGAVEVFRDITKENQIDKAKTEFVSLASHQLKTPLSAINWYSELLLSGDSGKLNKKQLEYLSEIANGSQRMVDLVNALLNVSRLELGTFSIEPKDVDLLSVLRSVLDELKPTIDGKNLKVTEKHDELPILQADPNLTRIIIQNILTNAVKYTADGGSISTNLTLIKRGESIGGKKMEQDAVIYITTDTGYGIPKEQQSNIFTKLFRADNVQEKDTDGTGLGLYIIKSILDSFGGKIWFESEKDKGTTFYITFPIIGMVKKEGNRELQLRSTSKE